MILNICYISYINSNLFDIYIMKAKVEVLIVQFNSVVGDLEGNTNRIINIIKKNRSLNSKKIIIFPELALCGYSPEDLLLRKDFSQAIENSINTIKDNIENNEYLVLGAPNYSKNMEKIWNSATYSIIKRFYIFIINNFCQIMVYLMKKDIFQREIKIS